MLSFVIEPAARSQRPNGQTNHAAGTRRSLAPCCGPVSGNRGGPIAPSGICWARGGNMRASTREVRNGSKSEELSLSNWRPITPLQGGRSGLIRSSI
jgi:hypothetical protein